MLELKYDNIFYEDNNTIANKILAILLNKSLPTTLYKKLATILLIIISTKFIIFFIYYY